MRPTAEKTLVPALAIRASGRRAERKLRETLRAVRPRLLGDLAGIRRWLSARLGHPPDLKFRDVPLPGSAALLVYLEGLNDQSVLDRDLVAPLLERARRLSPAGVGTEIAEVSWYKTTHNWSELLTALLSGNALLFIQGAGEGLIFDVNKLPHRAIGQPETERAARGPREAFTELIGVNLGLLRRRVRDASLRVESRRIGRRSGTEVAMVYLANLANPAVVGTIRDRLRGVDIPELGSSASLQGYLEDNPVSLFPQIRATENVEVAARALWQGRVVVLVDNTAFQLILPTTLWDFYLTTQDYNVGWADASLTRIIRFISWGLALYGPPVYIALTSINPDLVPTKLLMVISGTTQTLAFPPAFEAVVMYGIIEILREAALRLPKSLSTTLGTVGAVVVGTAIVKAGLVDSVMIIVVTVTSLASFTVPVFDMTGPWRVLVWVMMLFAYFFGLYGLMVATFFLMVHLSSLTSVGVPYLSPYGPLRVSDLKDTLVRFPLALLRKRPVSYRPQHVRKRERIRRVDPPRLRPRGSAG